MDFNEAKEKLKQGYIDFGFEFVGENDARIMFKSRKNIYFIPREDIESYADFEKHRSEFEIAPVECSICSKEYREQALIPLGPIAARIPFQFYLEKGNIFFGKTSSETIYVEIGIPSDTFINYFRLERGLLNPYYSMFGPKPNQINIRECYSRGPTIRVHNLSESSIPKAVTRSSQIIGNCLFQFSYLKNRAIWLRGEWPQKLTSNIRGFRLNKPYKSNFLPLSEVNFNSDAIRFYQFGMSTNIPELQFLAFYQVLEYFFISTSNERLYEKLSNKMKDPRFIISNSNLDNLAQIVMRHKQETDETEMLRNVMKKYLNEKDLIEFILAYEKHLNQKIYSKKHDVFGISVEIKLEEGHVFGNLAKHIKEIRNALVHSTDRYERKKRHIPFSKTTRRIELDILLMKFLAERVIIASAK